MNTVSIYAENSRIGEYLTNFINSISQNKSEITLTDSLSELQALTRDNEYDLSILEVTDYSQPRSNGKSALKLAFDLVKMGESQCLILTNESFDEMTLEKIENAGIFVIVTPVKREVLWATLKSISVAQNRMKAIKELNDKIRSKLDDVKHISRAKALLMTSLKMSEEQAHHFIEKEAMQRRMTKGAIAEQIIKVYDE
ncbi:MAG: ANTAR domain-containing protein [Clostridiales Family XIII bacterium]|nr:ANTAR domain-containing protein [Clostridiales Family XIII bacterium]